MTTTIAAFEAMRTSSVASLRALVAVEPTLEPRLHDRILPAIVHHAASITGPAPMAHTAGVAAITRWRRDEVAGWLVHLLLGTPSLIDERLIAETGRWLAIGDAAPQELAKLRCVLAYFDRIADAPPRGVFEVERVVGAGHDWIDDVSPLAPLEVHAEGMIEDAEGCLQVDFANAYLGGGVLSGGCVQEEIRFAIAPELIAGMLVSPRMTDREAIVLRGAERFATTSGYAFDLEFSGDFVDPCQRGADGTPDVEVVAIDAMDYRKAGAATQYAEPTIRRELDKARAGFAGGRDGRAIATGNWGCGVFLGDPNHKAIVQWLAASSVGRATRYFTFGDRRIGDLAGFVETATRSLGTVGAVARRLLEARHGGVGLFDAVLAAGP